MLSILISSYKRVHLFRRVLWWIKKNPPTLMPYEVIVVDELSEQSGQIQEEIWRSGLDIRYIPVSLEAFERNTGVKKFFNSPAWTNNVAFKHARGSYIALQGNEVIPWGNVYDALLEGLPDHQHGWAVSTTWDLPEGSILSKLDDFGSNLSQEMVQSCWDRVLSIRSNNVPNYLSIFTRECFEKTGGFDERYLAGVSCEDSDFMRRCFCLPNFKKFESNSALSLHQDHRGVSHLQRADPSVITEERLQQGVRINRALYDQWDAIDNIKNNQPWPAGELWQ